MRSGDAPGDGGPLQDWLLWPAARDELHARLLALSQRAAVRRSTGCPSVDDRGRMQLGDGCLELPPFEQKLAEVLIARFGESVGENTLLGVAGSPSSRTSLRGRLLRLCEDVNPLGLEVRPVGDDGFVMCHCGGPAVKSAA